MPLARFFVWHYKPTGDISTSRRWRCPSSSGSSIASSLTTTISTLARFMVSSTASRSTRPFDDKSVISRKPLPRSQQGDASPRVQDGPGLDHGSSRSELCCLSWLPIHLALARRFAPEADIERPIGKLRRGSYPDPNLFVFLGPLFPPHSSSATPRRPALDTRLLCCSRAA
jgi:hypothetical protein